ncbi:DUF2630 family protein [Pseudokineococcus marinus]|uniref:DUF2630 family protein n=1 Tax=Pseudokineococcus marinus TaxID=351215 RepID=A0A849BKZ5_9ACTN|nr:DUF2630 family protein [Pseudokineococcus marinus]NNH21983.1 DUF2630 family protein [Pseudokineococcus marinus]
MTAQPLRPEDLAADLTELVAEEHRLQQRASRSVDDEQRLRQVRLEQDRLWELRRRLRARRAHGEADAAVPDRSARVVEHHLR